MRGPVGDVEFAAPFPGGLAPASEPIDRRTHLERHLHELIVEGLRVADFHGQTNSAAC
jgi:hypothetical protein